MTETEQGPCVYVALPTHWALQGESLWARALGDDLYELQNIPFYAYGLNFGDVVRATAGSLGELPTVREVVRRGGHKTLRVMFSRDVPEPRFQQLMQSLPREVGYEHAKPGYFAVDIRPGTDIWSVCAQLDRWVEQELAGYETCEPRVPGSFDDAPRAAEQGIGADGPAPR